MDTVISLFRTWTRKLTDAGLYTETAQDLAEEIAEAMVLDKAPKAPKAPKPRPNGGRGKQHRRKRSKRGKPGFSYALTRKIAAAHRSGLQDVTTTGPEIVSLGERYGVDDPIETAKRWGRITPTRTRGRFRLTTSEEAMQAAYKAGAKTTWQLSAATGFAEKTTSAWLGKARKR
jgi:hypothetical protein